MTMASLRKGRFPLHSLSGPGPNRSDLHPTLRRMLLPP